MLLIGFLLSIFGNFTCHCEERSGEAISTIDVGLLRGVYPERSVIARNDKGNLDSRVEARE